MYFELKKSINPFAKQKHYFVLKSVANGQIMMTSEMYVKRSDALDTINSIRRALRGFSTVKVN